MSLLIKLGCAEFDAKWNQPSLQRVSISDINFNWLHKLNQTAFYFHKLGQKLHELISPGITQWHNQSFNLGSISKYNWSMFPSTTTPPTNQGAASGPSSRPNRRRSRARARVQLQHFRCARMYSVISMLHMLTCCSTCQRWSTAIQHATYQLQCPHMKYCDQTKPYKHCLRVDVFSVELKGLDSI